MTKALLSGMAALFFIAMAGCGEEEAETIALEEIPGEMCARIAECDPDMYNNSLGGDAGCESAVNTFYLGDCDPYDGEAGAECVNESNAMSCDEFNAALDAFSFPDACETMCGATD